MRKQIVACFVMVVFVTTVLMTNGIISQVEKNSSSEIIVIDPGHGGFDGGAESVAGVCEKDINLAISLSVAKLARADGWKVIMTREEDKALNKSENGAIRSKKTSDLKERKAIIDRVEPKLTISIHLNSFSQDRSVHGAQVFYPGKSENQTAAIESKKLAEMIQEEIKNGINDGTDRKAMSKDDIRILRNVTTPIVLVECGFLSNEEEAKLLENDQYQQKLAVYIYNGIMKYTGKEGIKPVKTVDSL